MKYKVVLEDSEEGVAVSVPGLPGCHQKGATEQEAIENIKQAIQEYLQVMEEISKKKRFARLKFLQKVGQFYNKSRSRKGGFWEKRYTATAVQTGEHLIRCFLYIDTNMVRAKVVKHPKNWEHGGYHEIVKPKQRYQTINHKEVVRLLDVDEKELSKTYQG